MLHRSPHRRESEVLHRSLTCPESEAALATNQALQPVWAAAHDGSPRCSLDNCDTVGQGQIRNWPFGDI